MRAGSGKQISLTLLSTQVRCLAILINATRQHESQISYPVALHQVGNGKAHPGKELPICRTIHVKECIITKDVINLSVYSCVHCDHAGSRE